MHPLGGERRTLGNNVWSMMKYPSMHTGVYDNVIHVNGVHICHMLVRGSSRVLHYRCSEVHVKEEENKWILKNDFNQNTISA